MSEKTDCFPYTSSTFSPEIIPQMDVKRYVTTFSHLILRSKTDCQSSLEYANQVTCNVRNQLLVHASLNPLDFLSDLKFHALEENYTAFKSLSVMVLPVLKKYTEIVASLYLKNSFKKFIGH